MGEKIKYLAELYCEADEALLFFSESEAKKEADKLDQTKYNYLVFREGSDKWTLFKFLRLKNI